jgi:hypothetical protein
VTRSRPGLFGVEIFGVFAPRSGGDTVPARDRRGAVPWPDRSAHAEPRRAARRLCWRTRKILSEVSGSKSRASSGGQKLIVTADEAFLSRIGE